MPETTTTTVVVEQHTLRIPATAKELIESLIFAAEEPLSLGQIRKIYQESAVEERRDVKENEIEAVISVLNDEFQQANKPYRIVQIAGGYQFSTLPDYAEWIGKLYKEQGRRKLSQSSLETLAIIAYRQPIIRPDIEAIRGVDCDYVLGTLLEKKLITIVGRAPTPGRPLLYGTTEHFLKHFGLNHITDLPKPREIEELLADTRYETERRMLEAEEQADKTKIVDDDFKSRLPHIPKKKADLDNPAAIVHKEARSLQVKKTDDLQQPVTPETNGTGANEVIQESEPIDESARTEVAETMTPTVETLEPPTVEDQPLAVDRVTDTGEEQVKVPLAYIPANFPLEVSNESSETDAPIVEHGDEESQAQTDETCGQAIEPAVVEAVESTETVLVSEEPIIAELKLVETEEEPVQEVREIVSDTEQGAPPEIESAVENVVTPAIEPIESQPEEVETEAAKDVSEFSEEMEKTSTVADAESVQTESKHVNTEDIPTQISELPVPPIVEVAESTDLSTPPFIAPIVDEVREPIQPTSRWQQFKEKIQGFIKKVFG